MKVIVKTNAINAFFTFPDGGSRKFYRNEKYDFEDWMTKHPEYFSLILDDGKILGRSDEVKVEAAEKLNAAPPEKLDGPTGPTGPGPCPTGKDGEEGPAEPEAPSDEQDGESEVPSEEVQEELDAKVHDDVMAQLEAEAKAEEEAEPDKVKVTGFKAVHKGFGKWVIEDEDGTQVAPTDGTFLKKAEAAEIVATMI